MCRTRRNLGRDEAANWPRQVTSTSAPQTRRRALFEGADGAEAFAVSRILGAMDVDTMWCPGPEGSGGSRCPLVEGGCCPLVEQADFVINNLGTDSPRCLAVVQAVDGAIGEDTPAVIVARRGAGAVVGRHVTRCHVVEGPITGGIVRGIAQTA